MKKILKPLAFLLCLVSFIPSCNDDEDCKICVLVTDNCGDVSRGEGIETCGDELEERESEEPITIGCVTTYWECY